MIATTDPVCRSGLRGWREHLHDVYGSLESFRNWNEVYGLAERLGFPDADAAWNENPMIEGSVDPSDYRVVRDAEQEL